MLSRIFSVRMALILAIVAGGGYWWYSKRTPEVLKKDAGKKSMDRFYVVKKADMNVTLLQGGTLQSKKNHKLSLGVPIRAKITWLISENVTVKKDEVLIRFEDQDVKDKITNYSDDLDNKKKSLLIAKEELEILKTSNKADIRKAKDNVESSVEAYEKYRTLEGPKARDSQKAGLADAEKKVEEAKLKHEEEVAAFDNKVFDSQESEDKAQLNLDKLEQAVKDAENAYNAKMLDWRIFKRYTQPNQFQKLENSLEQSKLNYQRAQVSAQSKLVQKQSSIRNLEKGIKRVEGDLERYQSYLSKMIIKSPVDGVVIYGDPTNRWHRKEVKVGADVSMGEALLTIPDMSSLVVKFDLPEQFRSKVKTGNEVIVTPDSMPTMKLHGKISKIASLPVNQIYWDKNSPKIYRSEIILNKTDERLVSGMNVQIEIVTQKLKKVISVPVETVFEENGEFYVFVDGIAAPKRTPVKIGVSDEHKVQILSGLKEEQKVYLYRPFDNDNG